jgi:opacity protein-like surface antigen
MDGAQDDGIYGLEYIASIPGAHYVDLKASGVASDGEPFERYMSTAFYVPGQNKRPVQVGEGVPPIDGFDGACGCEAEARFTIAGYGGVTIPHGAFDTIADPSYSLGIKPAVNFAGPSTGRWSAGLYVGYDHFSNAGLGGDFDLTHISPELEWTPFTEFCPAPAIHAGAGAYIDENGDAEFGWNVGASLGICLNDRVKLLTRYDYRSVGAFSRKYSTVQVGLRFSF